MPVHSLKWAWDYLVHRRVLGSKLRYKFEPVNAFEAFDGTNIEPEFEVMGYEPLKCTNPLDTSNAGLRISTVTASGNNSSFLFDTGSLTSVIPLKFCRNYDIAYPNGVQSIIPNRTLQDVGFTIGPITISFEYYTIPWDLRYTPFPTIQSWERK